MGGYGMKRSRYTVGEMANLCNVTACYTITSRRFSSPPIEIDRTATATMRTARLRRSFC